MPVSASKTKKLNSMASVRERTIPTEQPPPVGEVSANFSDRGCHMVGVTDPYGRSTLRNLTINVISTEIEMRL
jgi:hypothetical protein